MLTVKAAPGGKVPMPGKAKKITDKETVTVPDTAYYRRLIREGSLIQYPTVVGEEIVNGVD